MATARSLTGVDWLIRTYANALLTAVGRTAEATTVRGNQEINTNARLATALTRLRTLDSSVRAEYESSWDAAWEAAWETYGRRIRNEILAQSPIPLAEMAADPDANVKQTIKVAFRALGLRACQYVVNGGTL